MNISDNINVVLSELGRNNVPKAVLLLEDSLAVLNKRSFFKQERLWKALLC
jgi:hypothetical protein